MTLEIGKLNQRIMILEQRTIVDEIGNHTSKWEEFFSCWAYVTVQSSAQADDNGISKDVQTLQFYVRQNPHTVRVSNTNNRILFHEIEYDITSVVPDFQRKDYLKLTATARKGGVPGDLY